ncbi:MAG TPA: hypothetical protein VLX11_09010, partial [Candidatus Acidoferrales bacterium]|nr:hypothetical protein [Candidatus Acidoferrales bacterium]
AVLSVVSDFEITSFTTIVLSRQKSPLTPLFQRGEQKHRSFEGDVKIFFSLSGLSPFEKGGLRGI